MLQNLRDVLSLKIPAATAGLGETPTNNQAPWVTPQSLTFPGLSVVAGLFVHFAEANGLANPWLIGGVVSVVFGGFLLYLALSDPKADTSERGRATDIFIGLLNTGIMFITIVGVGSIGAPSS